MIKGWHLVSLYVEKQPLNPGKPLYISFAHYTGRQVIGGGCEYDKTLHGHLSLDDFRKAVKRFLVLEPGNKVRK